MTTLDDLFIEYLARIQPDAKAVSRAVAAHVPLREDLEKDATYGPFVLKTMLSGSYGRDTSILHIKDVDVIIQTSFTAQELQKRKREDETEQECFLRLTQEAIRRTGRDARTRKARRSIHVKLPEEINDIGEKIPELTMDIVPVLTPSGKDKDPMTIADRELRGWFDTFPATQLSDSETRNKDSAEIRDRHSYKPLVKIMRAWKRVHFRSQKTPKGFVLECLTAEHHNPAAKQWIESVRDLFQNVCWAFPEPVLVIPDARDISNSSPNRIPVAKTLDEAKDVVGAFHRHLTLIKQAVAEAETDLDKAATTLRRVFGQDEDDICFPMPSDLEGGSHASGSKRSPGPFTAPSSKSDVREAPPFG